MINQCILAVLTIVALTVSVKCAGTSYFPDFPKTVPDITKFYTANATIYTLRTTKRLVTCKVDEVANQTDSSVFFKRSYCKGEKWVNKTLEGTFISVSVFARGTFDAMIVHPPGIMGKRIEQLLYADPGFHCGVFKIFLNLISTYSHPRAIYELRVRDSYDRPFNAKCISLFRKKAENNYVDAYAPTCTTSKVVCK
ncbi:uncharacterized protein LOC119167336 [Rhipicephalus microplus]|uniref:uncharacterized protein LOC119167336 n=1 Tax=Rhipicephalus microplus TaxID=6941 RepID=UPI0018891EEB|nr:uncharacterized protein LOC119167336 [Rhipicephalus microplus]